MKRAAAEKMCEHITDSVRTVMKAWDESLHPRDENGRFTSGGGSIASTMSPSDLMDAYGVDEFPERGVFDGDFVYENDQELNGYAEFCDAFRSLDTNSTMELYDDGEGNAAYIKTENGDWVRTSNGEYSEGMPEVFSTDFGSVKEIHEHYGCTITRVTNDYDEVY